MNTNTNISHHPSANVYAKPLLNLDEGLRVEIIHILLNSIGNKDMKKEKKKYDLYTCFKGSWGKEGISTDEYCRELREGITEPKDIEAW